jgi:hypothetical protein
VLTVLFPTMNADVIIKDSNPIISAAKLARDEQRDAISMRCLLVPVCSRPSSLRDRLVTV